ncbi:DUF190 domain-containing protein [Terriglobus aquaticus]|uniref:DUF190 domain-containing protein n=1 Tax=Terriglobus aquaticus TaxID=940139 RepID=A0ABW9KIS1_9BACT|nr:DUF190 domain-containing protein [Terriglobus aquaticus]
MLAVGPATKVTIYLNQDTGSPQGFLRDEILTFLRQKEVGIGGATVLHAFAGYGSHGQLHKADEHDVAGLHLPVVIFFVEAQEKVESILPALLDLVTDGMIEAHPTQILKRVASKERVIS